MSAASSVRRTACPGAGVHPAAAADRGRRLPVHPRAGGAAAGGGWGWRRRWRATTAQRARARGAAGATHLGAAGALLVTSLPLTGTRSTRKLVKPLLSHSHAARTTAPSHYSSKALSSNMHCGSCSINLVSVLSRPSARTTAPSASRPWPPAPASPPAATSSAGRASRASWRTPRAQAPARCAARRYSATPLALRMAASLTRQHGSRAAS
jgi:hypothetical protein